MDKESLAAIDARAADIPADQERAARWSRQAIEEFITTGKAAELHFASAEEFKALVQLLGLQNGVAGDAIKLVRVASKIERDEKLNTSPKMSGTVDLHELLALLPDTRDFWSDFPNDFTISVGVQIDDTSLLVLTWEQEETFTECKVCGHCSFPPCEHFDGNYEYINEYWALLLNPADTDNIDWDRGEVY